MVLAIFWSLGAPQQYAQILELGDHVMRTPDFTWIHGFHKHLLYICKKKQQNRCPGQLLPHEWHACMRNCWGDVMVQHLHQWLSSDFMVFTCASLCTAPKISKRMVLGQCCAHGLATCMLSLACFFPKSKSWKAHGLSMSQRSYNPCYQIMNAYVKVKHMNQ